MAKETSGIKIIAVNKKASFNYFLSDFLECGIALLGTEIKSLRVHGASLVDSYVVLRGEEMEVINMHINPYDQGNIFNHDPLRNRKLLLHKKEIRWFADKVKRAIEQKGLNPETAEKEVKLIDKRRANHYNTFTERTWGNRTHYDLLINSSLVGVEKTADMIAIIAQNC